MKTVQQSYPKLAEALQVPSLFLKREDLNPYGSHKGRSIPLMIKHYVKQGNIRSFAISSSGNAALAAAIAVQKHNQNNATHIQLTIFVGMHIDQKKQDALLPYLSNDITLIRHERPKQAAIQYEQQGNGKNLRQSTDELALRGYYELANELCGIPEVQAIFIPTSSGTTAEGIADSCIKQQQAVQIHIVQTPTCAPLVSALNPAAIVGDTTIPSLAGAIVDHVAHRKTTLISKLQALQGNGWIAKNEEITQAIALVKETTDITLSPTSALSIVGVQQAVAAGYSWKGPVVCLITGP